MQFSLDLFGRLRCRRDGGFKEERFAVDRYLTEPDNGPNGNIHPHPLVVDVAEFVRRRFSQKEGLLHDNVQTVFRCFIFRRRRSADRHDATIRKPLVRFLPDDDDVVGVPAPRDLGQPVAHSQNPAVPQVPSDPVTQLLLTPVRILLLADLLQVEVF